MELDETQILRGQTPLAWSEWEDGAAKRAGDIPEGATRAMLLREKASHRGIAARGELRELVAFAVNQDFLDEICELTDLEYLDLNYPVTAGDLSGLKRLRRLRTLRMNGVRKITDFSPVMDLPELKTLMIEHAPHLTDLTLFREAHHLRSLGLEGSMWTTMRIASLKPLAGLRSLEALFLTSVVLKDKGLACLAECPRLRILDCARFAPKPEFDRLRALMPGLDCLWCDKYEIDGR
jgi:hypothetical protein